MSRYDNTDNTELVELIEQGMLKGYWDRKLIPELKKRFKDYEKREKLLKLYKEYFKLNTDRITTTDSLLYTFNRLIEIKNEIKELENNEN